MENNKTKSLLDQLPSRTAFWGGAAVGAGVLFAIGFIVLLILMWKGVPFNASATDETTKTTNTNIQPTTTNTAPQPTDEIQLAAITDEDWIRGNKNAKVSVVEFSDTECPFCKKFHPTMQRLIEEYPDDVNWVYRHFPLDSLHQKARRESEATECAGEQGKFWEYLDRLFEITPSNDGLQDTQLPQIAEDVGLNVEEFETCLESGTYASKVAEDVADAQAAGGRGTPYSVVVVGDEKIPVSGAVPYEQLKTIIDSVLE